MNKPDNGHRDPNSGLIYDVDEPPRSASHWLIYTGQWVVTMVYAVVWGYAIVGRGLGFEGPELADYMVRVVFLIGLSTLLQAWWGHRFAMVSGPNVIPSLAIVAAFQTGGREYALQSFTAQALAGVVIVLLAVTGVISRLRHVWSPLVLGAMIMIIGLSVARVGLEQMTADGFSWPFWAAVALALGGALLSIRGRGVWATLSTLLVIGGGYLIFGLGGAIPWDRAGEPALITWPRPFPYGMQWPPWDLTLTMLVVGLMAALNLYGNLHGYAEVVKHPVDPPREKRTFTVFGVVENVVAGIFGVPGTVAYGENLGIVMLTRVAARAFLIAAAVIFTAFAFLGPMAALMAAMPLPVAGAVLLGIASTVIGLGAQTWSKAPAFERREIAIVSFAVFLALGLSQLPEQVWESAPRVVATIFTNPVITVMLLVMLLEQGIFRQSGPPDDGPAKTEKEANGRSAEAVRPQRKENGHEHAGSRPEREGSQTG